MKTKVNKTLVGILVGVLMSSAVYVTLSLFSVQTPQVGILEAEARSKKKSTVPTTPSKTIPTTVSNTGSTTTSATGSTAGTTTIKLPSNFLSTLNSSQKVWVFINGQMVQPTTYTTSGNTSTFYYSGNGVTVNASGTFTP